MTDTDRSIATILPVTARDRPRGQADGYFNAAKGPWAGESAEVYTAVEQQATPRAAAGEEQQVCTFGPPQNVTYIKGCPSVRGSTRCRFFKTLPEVEASCFKTLTCTGVTPAHRFLPTLLLCGGACVKPCRALIQGRGGIFGLQVTYQATGSTRSPNGDYSMRSAAATTPSPPNEPSVSWLLQPGCHPPPPPPPPPPPLDPVAAAHSAAAYAGMARTDPQATWVYQTWIWRGFQEEKLPYLKGWLSSIPKGKGLMLDQTA